MCKQAFAARVQLNGCYFHYETDGFDDDDSTPKHELLHETCSEKKAGDGGFIAVRDAAFIAMESEGVNDKGFYEADYEHVHVMAQCEGDLWGCDCSECVGIAVEIAQKDCGSSVSGQVYLDKCFLSYAYNSKGKPGNSYPEEEKNGKNTGKTVAIVLGAAAAVTAGFMLLKLMKSRCNKNDDI
ncbi:hypothetical protein GH714_001381 [Hevea brasiliensis]|uniref:Gnk2-homologous domain-containing protein n=1 Tax=Hevea brasiliensis TaxID=3981 RepID=A0A6A6KF75_HEVBR|nr:hypothetical protein GH714_001381 [Hevea brasiliensis]